MTSRQPLVSVCLPVLNQRDLVCEAIDSALGQDYSNIEIVVVDDGSRDGTPEVLRGRYGDRIRLLLNPARVGQARATGRCIRHAHGAFVKFLDHDDTLEPNSVSRLVEVLERHPTAGMAFGRRNGYSSILTLPMDCVWRERYGEVHTGFKSLDALNPGKRLFEEMLANGLRENWIGEPTSVMVRRRCLEHLGGLHLYVQAPVDLDLWLRVMAHYDVAFVDEQLSTFRHFGDSQTDRARGARAALARPTVDARGTHVIPRAGTGLSAARSDALGGAPDGVSDRRREGSDTHCATPRRPALRTLSGVPRAPLPQCSRDCSPASTSRP